MCQRFRFLVCVFFLALFLFIKRSECGGAIYFQWTYFRNNFGTNYKNIACDSLIAPKCDTNFEIIFNSTDNGIPYTKTKTSNYALNTNDFIFSDKIINLTNPDVYSMPRITMKFRYIVKVWDYKDGLNISPDLIDIMQYSIDDLSPTPNNNVPIKRTVKIAAYYRIDHSMQVEVWSLCDRSFYGTDCNTYCLASNGGVFGYYKCHTSTGKKICRPGYIGEDCLNTYCSINPCKNNGTCINLDDGYTCNCDFPFGGENCQDILNFCENNPFVCLNGGNCSHKIGNANATCSCPIKKFEGLRCELDYANCLRNDTCGPHSISCTEIYGSFKCNCEKFWTGQDCRTNIDECHELDGLNSNVCANEATCVNLPASTYYCICKKGFTGTSCEFDIDECAQSTNGFAACSIDRTMHCANINGGYTCVCKEQWTGEFCNDTQNLDAQTSTTRNNLSIYVGIPIICIIIIVLVVAFIFLYKKKKFVQIKICFSRTIQSIRSLFDSCTENINRYSADNDTLDLSQDGADNPAYQYSSGYSLPETQNILPLNLVNHQSEYDILSIDNVSVRNADEYEVIPYVWHENPNDTSEGQFHDRIHQIKPKNAHTLCNQRIEMTVNEALAEPYDEPIDFQNIRNEPAYLECVKPPHYENCYIDDNGGQMIKNLRHEKYDNVMLSTFKNSAENDLVLHSVDSENVYNEVLNSPRTDPSILPNQYSDARSTSV